MKAKTTMAAALAASLLVLAGPALAHPQLVNAAPAEGASVAATNHLTLTFNEQLMPKLSGIDLLMVGNPGTVIGGMKTTVGEDGKTLIIDLQQPLAAGKYQLDWHAVSPAIHRTTGSFTFTVR